MGSDGDDGKTSLGGLEKALTELQKQTTADKEQEAKDLTAVNEQLKGTQSELGAAVDALEQALKQQMEANKDQEAKELSEAVTAREKSLAELKAQLMGSEGDDGKTSLGGLEKALTELQKQTAADKEQEA